MIPRCHVISSGLVRHLPGEIQEAAHDCKEGVDTPKIPQTINSTKAAGTASGRALGAATRWPQFCLSHPNTAPPQKKYVYMYIYIYICMCIYVCVYIYIYLRTCPCTHIDIIYTHVDRKNSSSFLKGFFKRMPVPAAFCAKRHSAACFAHGHGLGHSTYSHTHVLANNALITLRRVASGPAVILPSHLPEKPQGPRPLTSRTQNSKHLMSCGLKALQMHSLSSSQRGNC